MERYKTMKPSTIIMLIYGFIFIMLLTYLGVYTWTACGIWIFTCFIFSLGDLLDAKDNR